MPHILKIYRDFTKGLAPFSLDEILKRERIWKVFLLLCSLLAFGFIFLLKMEFFANDIWRITIQLNFSVYAWKPESFCAVSLTSVLSTCHYQAEEGLEMEGRGVSVDIVKEIQGEKERIRGNCLQNKVLMGQVKLMSLLLEVLVFLSSKKQKTNSIYC